MSKENYNQLLERCQKATEWLNTPERTEEEKEKYLPAFQQILNQINILIMDFESKGLEMTRKQILYGFGNWYQG